MWLFLAFIAVPLIEIALFIQIGSAIGLLSTLAIVIVTAILGTYLVRNQGAMALNNLRSSFGSLSDPTEPLANGAMILFSGALLLTPGFFTDAVGFALLVPGVRTAVYKYIKARVSVAQFQMGPDGMRQGGMRAGGMGSDPRQEARGHGSTIDVVEADYEEVTQVDPNAPQSGWTKK
jgi:UPF0716 protein FxsA